VFSFIRCLTAGIFLIGVPASPAADRVAVDQVSGAPVELRIVTWNVLADPVAPDERARAIGAILAGTQADVIALQEVAPWFAERLLQQQWTAAYHRPLREGRTVIAHEFVVLSRFPVVAFHSEPLPGAQRRVLHSVTLDLAGTPTVVATCHLESLLADGPIRAGQLDRFFAHVAPAPEAIFLGDFNFGDGEQPESARLPAEFVDAWLAVRAGEPGHTWSVERSRMARRGSFPGEGSRRLDRILVKSAHWTPSAARIIGDAPLIGTQGEVFPSDHFGLLAVLRRN
jgi:endonuclease/exonuclease/phosphatase family metal-dependent hydrolase